jgi:hypothetical protein
LTMSGSSSLPEIPSAKMIAQTPTIGSYTLAMARAGNDWIDPTK